jgi:NAD(P)-dependent dehydrogenase (short-subunit alcohol dehydrogenase family)
MSYWTDKVAIVTGGSRGLGRAVAYALATSGARVVVAARDADALANCAREFRAGGADITTIVTDVTQSAQVDNMVQQAVDRYGRLDVLVNAAGRSTRTAIAETTPEAFTDLLEVNFLATVRCARAALPHLISTEGHLVNIGSLASKTVVPYLGAYPASKFAVAAYSQQLRLELGREGLHVLLVCPGPILRPDGGARYDQLTDDLPEAARQPGGGSKIRPLLPTHVARKILKYCERRKVELVMPGRARLLFAAAQLCPSLVDRYLRRKL